MVDICEKKKETIYKFRFIDTDKRVRLTEKQLDRIPYLSALLSHKDHFLSIENENGEYVLNHPIRYRWFIPILRSITSEQPYILFNELPEDENILDTLQLFDYLGIKSFDPPLLKGHDSLLTNPSNDTDGKMCLEYHRASLSEARNIAAQFVLSISKNEYNLHHPNTIESIFQLIKIIFSNDSVFSSRFRYHTLTTVKEYCLPLFSNEQRCQLPTARDIARSRAWDSWMYLYDDDQTLPEGFNNAFAWKGVWTLRKMYDAERKLTCNIIFIGRTGVGKSSLIRLLCDPYYTARPPSPPSSYYIHVNTIGLDMRCTEESFISENRPVNEQHISEAKSARSGRFNTLPKRPNVDKFKHRFGPKAQKHR